MAFDTIFNEPFLTRRPLFLFSFSAPRSLWKQDEGEVQQLWRRGEERKAKTMSTMYNPGDREWQTFQRHPDRIKMITSTAWFFHPRKLSPIFRKIQSICQTWYLQQFNRDMVQSFMQHWNLNPHRKILSSFQLAIEAFNWSDKIFHTETENLTFKASFYLSVKGLCIAMVQKLNWS